MGVWEKMPDEFLDALGREFVFEPPRAHGTDTVQTIEHMLQGAIKVFVGMGGNFLAATPDTERTAEALRSCRLTVQVSTKLNRGHLVTGRQALILPCLGRTERDVSASSSSSPLRRGKPQFVTVENSMSVVSASEGKLAPAADTLRSEVAIICGMAEAALGARSTVAWSEMAGDYDRIRDHIAEVVPGFHDLNARVREPGGFHLPSPTRKLEFHTSDGKAHFTVNPDPASRAHRRAAADDDDAQSTTSTTPPCTGWTIATAGCTAVGASSFSTSRTWPSAASSPATGVDLVSEFVDGRARRRALPRGPLRHPASLRRQLLPRGQRAGAARQRRRHEQHADVENRSSSACDEAWPSAPTDRFAMRVATAVDAVVVAVLLVVAPVSRARAGDLFAPIALEWDAPPGCPDGARGRARDEPGSCVARRATALRRFRRARRWTIRRSVCGECSCGPVRTAPSAPWRRPPVASWPTPRRSSSPPRSIRPPSTRSRPSPLRPARLRR